MIQSFRIANRHLIQGVKRNCNPAFSSIQISLFSSSTEPAIVYEGAFSSMALRLKRISITSAVASIVGIPALLITQSGGEVVSQVPLSGQIAVGGTCILAACGSTLALDFCFSPYVHSLQWVEGPKTGEEGKMNERLVKATSRNLLSMQVETIFHPQHDVLHAGQFQTYRPFCNFKVKKDGKDFPLFVHPEMLHDEKLRLLLLGEEIVNAGIKEEENVLEKEGLVQGVKKRNKKDDDDEFL